MNYRSTIASSPYTDQLVEHLSEWVRAGPIVQVGDFHLGVNKDCPTRVSSMKDPVFQGGAAKWWTVHHSQQ